MRKTLDELKDRLGEQRVVEKFLLFPRSINGELRWLEKAKILQEVTKIDVGGSMEWGRYKHKWRDKEWAD